MRKLFLFAIILHVFTAWFSIGRYHADEQYQVLEFAAYKTGQNNAADMPWEFHAKARPAIQVGFAYAVIKCCNFLSVTNPFIQAFLLRLCASLLGLFSVFVLLKYFKDKLSEKLFKALCFLSLFYCFLPYFHARFSSENICASLFLIGLFAYLQRKGVNVKAGPELSLRLFLCGLLMGLAGVVRFQMNFMTFGFLCWVFYEAFFKKQQPKQTVFIVSAGVIAAIGLGILCDKWFYGRWELTTWNYIYQNIVLHKADGFGVQPIWFYFERFLLDGIPPFSLIVLICFFYFFIRFPKHVFTWMIVPFLLAHIFTGHKELRFLFPLLPFVPLICVLAYEQAMHNEKLLRIIKNKFLAWLKPAFLIVNTAVLLVLALKPADDYTPTLKFLYENYYSVRTTLVLDKDASDPYKNDVSLNFYRAKNVVSMRDTVPFLPPVPCKLLFLTSKRQTDKWHGYKLKKVFSSIPGFLYHFNFNGWIERTNVVTIYEVEQ